MQSDIPASCRLRVYLYGPLEVWKRESDGTWQRLPKEVWGKERATRSVFKRLLAAPRRRLKRLQIIDDLWPEKDEAQGDNTLSRAVSVIRRVIGEDLVVTRDAGYELADQALIWLDAQACEALLKEADQRKDRLETLPLLETALALFEHGEYLEQEDGTWCHALRKPQETLLKQCRLWLAQGHEAQGRLLQAKLEYQALLQAMPPDEEALRCYLLMLYRQGRTGEAFHCYEEVKSTVEKEGYGLSPVFHDLIAEMRARPLFPHLLLSIDEISEGRGGRPLLSEKSIHPLFSSQTVGRSLILETLILPNTLPFYPDTLYVGMETEVMAASLHWRRSSASLLSLQHSIQDIIRKHDTMHKDQLGDETRMSRRHALLAIAMLPLDVYGVKLFSTETVLLPSEEVLSLCAAGLSACWELRQYEAEGMLTIQRILAAYLPTLERLVHQSSLSQRKAAYLASQGYLLVGVLAEYYGKLDQMEAASRTARYYGQLAQDANLEISALMRLAVKFDFENRDTKALETYQEALALPGFSLVTPLLQSRAYAGLAGTHAYCGQNAQALSYLSQAKEMYPDNPELDPSFAFAVCSNHMLALWEGLTLQYVAHYTEALQAFSRFASITPLTGVSERARAEHLNYMASVAVQQRDLEQANLYLDTAEEIAWNIQHQQRYAEVRETFRDMQLLWPDESKVKALQEKIYAR